MKIHKDIKIEAIASGDRSRYNTSEPFLDTSVEGAPLLVATNGKAMAAVPVELQEGDAQGYVSADVLKTARKQAGRLKQACVKLNGVATLPDESTMPRHGKAKDGEFPKWRNVWPEFDGKSTVRVAIDAELLADLAKAMGTRGVVLKFVLPKEGSAADSAIEARPCGVGHGGTCAEPSAKGLLMPLRVE